MARWSSGRMRDPQSRGMGSIPIRATEHGQVVELADTRRSERRATYWRGSSSLPLATLLRVGQRPSGPHKPGPPGATPGPAT